MVVPHQKTIIFLLGLTALFTGICTKISPFDPKIYRSEENGLTARLVLEEIHSKVQQQFVLARQRAARQTYKPNLTPNPHIPRISTISQYLRCLVHCAQPAELFRSAPGSRRHLQCRIIARHLQIQLGAEQPQTAPQARQRRQSF